MVLLLHIVLANLNISIYLHIGFYTNTCSKQRCASSVDVYVGAPSNNKKVKKKSIFLHTSLHITSKC